jgi:sortase A
VETVHAGYVHRLATDPEKLIVAFTGVWVLDPLPKNPQARAPSRRRGRASG